MPRHKVECSDINPTAKIEEKWFRSCLGLTDAVHLAAYNNHIAIPVIEVRTELGDVGTRLTIAAMAAKREVIKFPWGWRLEQNL